jgi:hypothetical protein
VKSAIGARGAWSIGFVARRGHTSPDAVLAAVNRQDTTIFEWVAVAYGLELAPSDLFPGGGPGPEGAW